MALQQNEALGGFSGVIEHARPRLARVIKNFEIPQEDADDIIQDASLSLLARWDKVRNPESWLIAAVKRKCIMYWRKRRGSLVEAVDSAILDLLGESSVDKNNLGDLQVIFDQLPSRCRELLKLRYGLGYGPAEAADILGYHASSIRKITNRCLAALTREILTIGFLGPKSTEE